MQTSSRPAALDQNYKNKKNDCTLSAVSALHGAHQTSNILCKALSQPTCTAHTRTHTPLLLLLLSHASTTYDLCASARCCWSPAGRCCSLASNRCELASCGIFAMHATPAMATYAMLPCMRARGHQQQLR